MQYLRRRMASLAAALAGAVLLSQPILAQQGSTTGTIRGRVSNPEGQPVVGAQITARNTSTGVQRAALSDADGRYSIPLLQPGGPYTVRVTSIGYRDSELTDLQTTAGGILALNFRMDVQAVQIQGVTVVGSAPRVDVSEGGVVARVSTAKVENLPVSGRRARLTFGYARSPDSPRHAHGMVVTALSVDLN